MKELILKILNNWNINLEGYSYYNSNYGVSEYDFDEVADEILKLIESSYSLKSQKLSSKEDG